MANRSRITIWVLTVTLIGSNAWWFCSTLNESIVAVYREDRLWSTENSLKQALAILPFAASETATKEGVVAAAKAALPEITVREGEGKTTVGALILTFDKNGRVAAVEALSAPTFERRYF